MVISRKKEESMVDAIDLRIIDVLEADARLSFAEIGRRVNLSTSAARERLIKLEDAGVIESYTAKLNHSLLGFALEAIVLLKSHDGKLPILSKIISSFPEVKEARSITGDYNIHVRAVFRDMDHLKDFLDGLLPYGDTVTYLSSKIKADRMLE
ncbi:MAG: Lrp/AsnC family transcriptional regulator [Crocinitomicaceae bacterium]|nr:Lrp/AsnC family transcriptional regulator [Crocinitomicaceae bacterium]